MPPIERSAFSASKLLTSFFFNSDKFIFFRSKVFDFEIFQKCQHFKWKLQWIYNRKSWRKQQNVENFQNQKLLIEKKLSELKKKLLTVSMQKKQIFRLVAFSERSEHSNGIGRGKTFKTYVFYHLSTFIQSRLHMEVREKSHTYVFFWKFLYMACI